MSKVLTINRYRTATEDRSAKEALVQTERNRVDDCGSNKTALKRSLVWLREMPGIIRGLLRLGWPMKWRMLALLGLNSSLAAWEALQAYVLAGIVATLSARDPSSFLKTAIAVAWPFILLEMPNGVLIPFVRDHFAMRKFWLQMNRGIALKSLPEYGSGREPLPELRGSNTAGVAREGRSAAQNILNLLLRDTPYAIVGVIVLGVLYEANPYLALLLLIGMSSDLWVTLKMDIRCNPHFDEQKKRELEIFDLECKLHDPNIRFGKLTSAERMAHNADRARFREAFEAHVQVGALAQWFLINYQAARNGLFWTFKVSVFMLLAYAVHIGTIDLAAYVLFTTFAIKGCEPVKIFLGLQNMVMANRELLRRFGAIVNVDFGITAPR